MIDQQTGTEDRIPEAIAESVITIGDQQLKVYVLEDGRRVIAAEDIGQFFARFFGFAEAAA